VFLCLSALQIQFQTQFLLQNITKLNDKKRSCLKRINIKNHEGDGNRDIDNFLEVQTGTKIIE